MRVVRLLLFADVHGRRAALEALLEAAKRWGECELVCLGNLAGDAPENAETLELARRKGVTLVAGPLDKLALKDPVGIERAEVAYLRGAAAPRRFAAGGRQVLLTWDPTATDARALVVRPGETARLDGNLLCVGRVAGSQGEAPVALLDLETGEAKLTRVAWDDARDTLQAAR